MEASLWLACIIAGKHSCVRHLIAPVLCVDAGAVDTSDEDLPLPTLAGRHPSQPNRAAQPQALDAAVSEAISDAHKTLGTAAALPVVEAPAPSKASSMNQAQAAPSEAAAATQRNTPAEAETSAAEAEAAPAPRGSPEPRSAPPAAIELRTTRSRSKRMSQDASPSLSIASKQSLRNEPDGKAILAKPPSGRRKRSITPAHPPAAVTPSPAAAEAVAGMGPTATVKAASAGVKRQRTPDTPTAASKKPVASRRSSRLKATPLDQSEDLQPKTNSQIDPEAVLTAKHAASANSPPGGGMQLDSAATAEDNQEKNLAPTVTVGQTQALELAKPAAATAATDALHAASARATAAALDATHAVADALPQAVVEPVEGVSHSQPQSAVCDNVRASVEVLRQAEHPAQADAHVLDQHQGTTRPQSAAASTRGTTLDNHAPISPGKPAVGGKDTDTSNTEGVQGTLASDASGRAGVTAVAPALAPIQSAEDSVPLDVAVPSEAAAQCSDLEEAQPSRSDAAAAAASHEDASDAGQAAEIGLGSGFEEAQAPSIDATSLGAAPQAVDTGSASATKSVDSAAEPVALTGPYASPGTSGQDTSAPDAIMSLAVPAAANPPASTASAAGPSAVQPDARSPAVPAATSASAVQTEGVVAVASAPVSPLAASPPHELTVQSADLAATAAAAPPTAPPPPPHAAAFAAAEAPPSITEVPTAAAAVTAAPPTAVGAAAALTAAPPEAHAPSADAAPPTIAPTPTAAADADAAPTTTATHAKLKTVSISKPPQPSGSTRIGLPHRPSSLSKSLLGAAQQKAGSTHMRPILSKGLTPAPKTAKAPHRSPSEGSTGTFFWSESRWRLQGCLLLPHCHPLVRQGTKIAASSVTECADNINCCRSTCVPFEMLAA